jgi:hypothetical protein
MSLSGAQVFTMCKGADGREIKVRSSGGYIQWQYAGDSAWTNMVNLTDLKGADGKEVELRASGGYIQMRLTGGSWLNLVLLEDLKGPKGDNAPLPSFTFQTTTLPAGSNATVSYGGTYPNILITFGVPRGADAPWPAFSFSAEQLAPGATPTVTPEGAYPNISLKFGIPVGQPAAEPNFTLSAEKLAPGANPTVTKEGAYPNLNKKFGIPEGQPAPLPVFGIIMETLAENATPTYSITGTYPNLTINLGVPKGKDAVLPTFGISLAALEYGTPPTSSITGTYPNLTINLGIPKGKNAELPVLTFSAEEKEPGTTPEVLPSGDYPNIHLKFKIPKGLTGATGRPLVVLGNGNYGNWDNSLNQYVDSGVAASASPLLDEIRVIFEATDVRNNIQSNETVTVLFSKIKRWFLDLKALAFKDKVDYTTDIENLPTLPSKTSDLTNDSNFASVTYVDETIADEVSDAISDAISDHDTDSEAHEDIRDAIETAVSNHDSSENAHQDLRNLIGGGIGDHNVSETAHADIRTAIGTAVDDHNTSGEAHGDIRNEITTAEAAAKSYADAQIAAIPTASLETTGLMPAADVATLQSLSADVELLKGRTLRYPTRLDTDAPTPAQLSAVITAAGSVVADGVTVVDFTYNKEYTYYLSDEAWHDRGDTTVSKATNTTLGIVKGSTVDGQVYAETDGTLSVNGWDALNQTVDGKVEKEEGKGLSSADYTAEEKSKLEGIAAHATLNTASSTTPLAPGTAAPGEEEGYSRGDHVHPLQTSVTGNAGTAEKLLHARTLNIFSDPTPELGGVTGIEAAFDGSGNVVISATIPAATEELAGVMTAEDKIKLETIWIGGGGSGGGGTGVLPPESEAAYGVEWDANVTATSCTRIGNLDLHRSLPLQNKMKGCLLSDYGEINEYLPATSWLSSDRSGASGMVQTQIPDHYFKYEAIGSTRRARISEYPLEGYVFVPGGFYSSYEASKQWSTGKLCSVVNSDPDFRGGNNNAGYDGTYRSFLGLPVTNLTRTQFREAARLRGLRWQQLVYNLHKTILWFYIIEYANRDSQLPFNAQKDANGFAQGGLGSGVSTLSSAQWNSFNGYYPFTPCGHSDAYGNFSGETAYTAANLPVTQYVNRYRSIENPFGHIWKWSDGVNVEVGSSATTLYVCDDPAFYSDSGYVGYTSRGVLPRGDGYIKDIVGGTYGDFLPSAVGGGSTNYWPDYYYQTTSAGLKGVLLGAAAYDSANCGLAYANSTYAPTYASSIVGSRLCFLPA